MEEELIILGIDPGFGRMGFGCVHVIGSSIEPVDFGVMTTEAGQPFEERLLHLARDLRDLLSHHRPHIVSIEKLFFAKNSTTAMRVAEARGVVLVTVAEFGIAIAEFTPAQVKKAVTGDGKAGKLGMQRMVRQLLNLDEIPKPDDAADALALAITASTKRW